MSALDLVWDRLVRPALYRAGGDAEDAHARTLALLAGLARRPPLLRGLARLLAAERSPRRVLGLTFPSPVGVAAGVDKDGVALAAWPALGFGFVEAGTVTARAQSGNPRPRVFRLPASQAVINRMGFPNDGAAALAGRIAAHGSLPVPVGVSLGRSKAVSADEVDAVIADYLTGLRAVHAHADYLAVNVSSPNTPGLRGLQDRPALDTLVAALTAEGDALTQRSGRRVPLLVKIAPDLPWAALDDVLEICSARGVAGLIAANTTTTRDGILAADAGLRAEQGGLSGTPLRARALDVVRRVCERTDLPVIGVGGIGAAADATAMFDAGAALVQVYTGLVYRGPSLVRDINRAAARRDALLLLRDQLAAADHYTTGRRHG